MKFSVSRYNTQRNCLGQYYYKYVNETLVEEITWPATVAGTVTHSLFEQFYSNEKPVKLQKGIFKDFYMQELARLKSENKVFKETREYKSEGEAFFTSREKWTNILLRFLHKFLPQGKAHHEEEVKLEIDGVSCVGYIDLYITLPTGENAIFDFKTTSSHQNYFSILWKNDPQSIFYMNTLPNVSSFSYIVSNVKDKYILVNSRGEATSEDRSTLESMIKEFKQNHVESSEESLWSPEKKRCFWCSYKDVCTVAEK